MLMQTPPHDPNITAPNWSLVDVTTGETITLSEQSHPHGFAVMFICNHCPYVVGAIDEITAAGEKLKVAGIPLYAIMSNNYEFYTDDDPEHMKEFAREHNFSFPYLLDETQEVARAYDAVCTPDIFGFNSDGSMQYRGDAAGLHDAMMAIKETGVGPAKQNHSQGCSIKWKN